MIALEFEQKKESHFAKQKGKVCLFVKSSIIVKNVLKLKILIIVKRYCFKCMKPGHFKATCKSRAKCFKCQSNGLHTELCRNIDKVTEECKNIPANTDDEQTDPHNYLVCHNKISFITNSKRCYYKYR